jgi:hypothetical protein
MKNAVSTRWRRFFCGAGAVLLSVLSSVTSSRLTGMVFRGSCAKIVTTNEDKINKRGNCFGSEQLQKEVKKYGKTCNVQDTGRMLYND